MSNRNQQEAVYSAEGESLGHYGRRFKDIREIRLYVEEVINSDWWVERWPTVTTVQVERTRSTKWAGYACAKDQRVHIGYGGSEAVVLHELAHLVCPDEEHGPVYCYTLLMLVRHRMGFHAFGALQSAFKRRGCLDGRLLNADRNH